MVTFSVQRVLLTVVFLYYIGEITCSGLGKCPKFEYFKNFNLSRFAGRWYEIERSFYLMQVVSSCVTVDLAETEKGHLKVNVNTRSRWTEDLTVSEGIAAPTRRHPSLLTYKVVSKLPKMVSKYLPGAGIYQVIDTDHDNYAVLWSCTNYGLAHTDMIWIWGRQKEIDANVRIGIYRKLDEIRLDPERLILPKNENCSDTW